MLAGGVGASSGLFLDEAREHYARLVTGAGYRQLARIRAPARRGRGRHRGGGGRPAGIGATDPRLVTVASTPVRTPGEPGSPRVADVAG